MKKSASLLIKGAAFAALLLASFALGWKGGKQAVLTGLKPQMDTLYAERVDTLEIAVNRVIRERVTDTLRLYIHDTAYIEIPRWEKVYTGEEYRAVVSGYDPRLDSLTIYPKTITQTITETRTQTEYVKLKPAWSIGIQAGYGFSTETMRGCPYFGAGITYNLASFGYRRK